MRIGWFYLAVVFTIAIPHALFETWGITHYKVGWGEKLPQDKWWARNVINRIPFDIFGAPLLSRYHFLMFLFVLPAAVFTLGYCCFGRWTVHPPAGWIGWLIFTGIGAYGAGTLEDFLFFVFGTIFKRPYPHAFTRMIHGEATWHLNLPRRGKIRLPVSYYVVPLITPVLLYLMPRL